MEVLKGPLGSHLNYLRYIALPNCMEYDNENRRQKEANASGMRAAYERLRLFLNAIVTFNHVVDYFFHENKASRAWTDKQQGKITGDIRKNHKILADIAELANAFKHCRTTGKQKADSADLQEPVLRLQVSLKPVSVSANLDFDSIEDEDIIGEAFRFWVAYENNPDPEFLLRPSPNTAADSSEVE